MNGEHMQKALAWWHGRKRSEQILIGAGVAVGLVMGLQRIVVLPLKGYEAALTKQIDGQHAELRALRDKLGTLGPEQIKQLQDQNRERVLALEGELTQTRDELAELRASLVPAGKMAEVLGALLRTHRGVELAEVMNLPVVELRAPQEGAGKNQAPMTQPGSKKQAPEAQTEQGNDGPTLYKHGLRITLRGSYFDIAKYLSAVEDLPWRVYFDGLTLEVASYPKVEATVELHTLSEDEGWFFTS